MDIFPKSIRLLLISKLQFLPDFRNVDLVTYMSGKLFEQADKVHADHTDRIDVSEFYSNLLLLMYGYGPSIASNVTPTSLRFGELILKPPSWDRISKLFHCFDYDNANGLDKEQFQLCIFLVIKLIVVRVVVQTMLTYYSIKMSSFLFLKRNIGGKLLYILKQRLPTWMYSIFEMSSQVSVATMLAMLTTHNAFEIVDSFFEEKVLRDKQWYLKRYQQLRWSKKFDDIGIKNTGTVLIKKGGRERSRTCAVSN